MIIESDDWPYTKASLLIKDAQFLGVINGEIVQLPKPVRDFVDENLIFPEENNMEFKFLSKQISILLKKAH